MSCSLCFLLVISFLNPKVSQATDWVSSASSPTYRDTKLVTETDSPFVPHYFPIKGNTISRIAIICNKFCASNASCQAFSLYPNNTQYVCEYALENFCSHRQRVALQTWPGSTVWDKLTPGMTSGCIDKQFANKTNSSYCEIGRFGCKGTWPVCESCVTSCKNGNKTGYYNYTLWPEGPTKVPIFAFCRDKATIIIQKQVNLTNGTVWPNYTMQFMDMRRLSSLASYTKLQFTFSADGGRNYTVGYDNLTIDAKGALMSISCKNCPGPDDGINTRGTPLKRSPWVYANSTCGSFWFLNSTQGAKSTLSCPGGEVGVFGSVDVSPSDVKYKQTGIRWPRAIKDKKTLYYAEIRMDI